MREAWIYGDGEGGPRAARMLAELGFSPRRVPSGGLRPVTSRSLASYPSLALVLVGSADDGLAPVEILRQLRCDVDLCDVPLVAAVDAERAGAPIPALDADEIIVHPMRIEELGIRIARARSRHGISAQDELRFGSLQIDLAAYEVRVGGEPIELTHMEYRLLELLATHPGRVFARDRLLSRMWGRDHDGNARAIDGHVGRLRAKLDAEHGARICTVRNVGYRFDA
jgi:DNA-binding response OmpR family regulator